MKLQPTTPAAWKLQDRRGVSGQRALDSACHKLGWEAAVRLPLTAPFSKLHCERQVPHPASAALRGHVGWEEVWWGSEAPAAGARIQAPLDLGGQERKRGTGGWEE